MKVSVIIPCYNVAGYVERAIRSVWEQDHREFDVVAVDDGSVDGTLAELKRLETSREGPLLVIHQQRRGACAARNAGLAATKGMYLQFLDADDRLLPGKFTRQLHLARVNGLPALIAGAYRNEWEDGRVEDLSAGADPWFALIHGRAGTTTSNLWSREAVIKAGSWDESLASSQDHDLVFRMLRAGGEYLLDPVGGACILKRSRASISRTDPIGNWQRYITLRLAIRDHWSRGQAGSAPELVREAERYIFGAIRAIARADPELGSDLRERYLSADFEPHEGPPISRAYAIMHRILGFRGVESLARALDNLRQWYR